MRDQEQVKCNLNAIVQQLLSSVEIDYNFAMNSFKKEVNNRGFDEYYYKILNILITFFIHLFKLKMRMKRRDLKEMKKNPR